MTTPSKPRPMVIETKARDICTLGFLEDPVPDFD